MSILIKGMDMPTDCGKCFVGDRTICQHGCPLVPVAPHGELIDVSTVNLEDGPYEYQDWVEWAWEQYLNAPVFLPADPPKEET